MNYGKLHQAAMTDPRGRFDLPGCRTYQINLEVERAVLRRSSQGVLGGTVHPTRDAHGEKLTNGIRAIVGDEKDSGRGTSPFAVVRRRFRQARRLQVCTGVFSGVRRSGDGVTIRFGF